SEHGVHSRLQSGLLGELKQEFQGFVGDTILRVIEIDSDSLNRKPLAPLWIVGKELPHVQVADLRVMLLQCLPSRPVRQQLVFGVHLRAPLVRYAVRCAWVPTAMDGLPPRVSSHRRKPPRNALLLSPTRQPGGSSFSFLTFPPPKTTSSGSSA